MPENVLREPKARRPFTRHGGWQGLLPLPRVAGDEGVEYREDTVVKKPAIKQYLYVDGCELKIKGRSASPCGQHKPKGPCETDRVRVGATGPGNGTLVFPSDSGIGVRDVVEK